MVWVCTPWGTGVEENLDFTFYLPHSRPLRRLGTIILTLCSAVNPPLQYLASTVGTERAGQDRDLRLGRCYLRVLPWLVFCLMIMVSLVLCLLNIFHFTPSLSRGKSVCRLGDNGGLTMKWVWWLGLQWDAVVFLQSLHACRCSPTGPLIFFFFFFRSDHLAFFTVELYESLCIFWISAVHWIHGLQIFLSVHRLLFHCGDCLLFHRVGCRCFLKYISIYYLCLAALGLRCWYRLL